MSIPSNSISIVEKFTIKEGFTTSGLLTPDNTYNLYSEIIDPHYDVSKNLSNEQKRLSLKANIINPLYYTKTRNDAFSKSDTLRRNAYWRMGMIVLLTFIICFALVILKNMFPIIPSFLFDFAFIALFSGSIIYVFFTWVSIQERDPMDFNKLKLPPPTEKEDIETQKAKINNFSGDLGDLTDLLNNAFGNACIGNACCPAGTTFGNNRCEGFTSLRSGDYPKIYTVYRS